MTITELVKDTVTSQVSEENGLAMVSALAALNAAPVLALPAPVAETTPVAVTATPKALDPVLAACKTRVKAAQAAKAQAKAAKATAAAVKKATTVAPVAPKATEPVSPKAATTKTPKAATPKATPKPVYVSIPERVHGYVNANSFQKWQFPILATIAEANGCTWSLIPNFNPKGSNVMLHGAAIDTANAAKAFHLLIPKMQREIVSSRLKLIGIKPGRGGKVEVDYCISHYAGQAKRVRELYATEIGKRADDVAAVAKLHPVTNLYPVHSGFDAKVVDQGYRDAAGLVAVDTSATAKANVA